MHRNIRNDNSALLLGLSIGGSGGSGGEIPLPSGKWNVIVTDKENGYFTLDQMKQNAANINNYFKERGWSATARMALLGNMEKESTMNPGLIEVGGGTTSAGPGRGLVQWTPGQNLLTVLDVLYGGHDDWYDGGKQCAVLFAEYQESVGDAHRGIEPQWYQTSSYPITWRQWATGNYDLKYLTNAFMYNYLRPGDLNQPDRYVKAQYWSSVFIKG